MGTAVRFILIAWIMMMLPVFAYAGEFHCPDNIQVQQYLTNVTSGWTSYTDTNAAQTFKGIALYDGPPVDMASLVPDETGDNEDTVWSGLKQAVPERSFWMACEYRNTAIKLVRELPKSITGCRLRDKNVMVCK